MKNQNQLIGQSLWVDESAIDLARQSLLSKVIPKVKAIIDEYNKLESLPDFTQKIWKGIVADRGKSVCDLFLKQAEADLKQFKNSRIIRNMMDDVEAGLETFRQSVLEAEKAANDAFRGYITANVLLQLTDVKINSNGEPVPDLKRITETLTHKIETLFQAEAYEIAKAAEKALEDLRVTLEGTDVSPTNVKWIADGSNSWGLFEYDLTTGKLTFNAKALIDVQEPEEGVSL